MRERWFGRTGRKVPEVALEGSVDVTGALELDDVGDLAALRAAHEQGIARRRPRRLAGAGDAPRSRGRRSPACSSPTPALLDVDLADLTYG